ncbi:coproporphyrinogen dehydrogenase HemZ [Mycoplasmatota bacterium]|nr:coproporphyrinogen dehydrogenase HemZ [Mycoplasmatota bacterium]
MKFHIIGVPEKNIRIALLKLLKAFEPHHEIVSDKFDYMVYIATIIYEKEVKVFLKCDNVIIERTTEIISNVAYDKKYLILVVFYQLLVKLTNKKLSYGVLTGIRPTKLVHHYKKSFSDEIVLSILQNKYLISHEKAKLLLTVVNNQYHMIKDFEALTKDVSVYINIPFCLSRCSYCSFTSYPSDYKKVTRQEYLKTLFKEIEEIGHFLRMKKINITTIYIGGGTPTVLNDEELYDLLYKIESSLVDDLVLEYTLECGRPDTITKSKLEIINQFSVSRISINPQTFNENTLFAINRKHTIKDILDNYKQARALGMENINMDLIIGLPNENLDDYINSIDQTIQLLPESITIHYLARKKGSKLYNEEINNHTDDYFKLFAYAYEILKRENYNPYYLYRQKNISGNLENIGYCQKGYESLYNILMIEEAQTIIGLGCASSSKFLNHKIILNPKDLISYIKSHEIYLNKKIKGLEETLLKVEENNYE